MTLKNYLLPGALLLFIAVTIYFLRNPHLHVDECDYFPQILRFASGDYTVDPKITALPTYCILQAFFSKVTGAASVPFFRLINIIFALTAIFMFMRTRQIVARKDPWLKTLQFAFFPFIFPYFFLIYTDILSLALVLTGFYFFSGKKYGWSGLFCVLACAVRQNNIIWLGLFLILSYLEIYNGRITLKNIATHLAKYWSFLLGIVLFTLFVILNKGIAVGDRSMHPPFSLQMGNVYFMLFLFFILFLPLHLKNFRKIAGLMNRYKITLLGILLFYVIFLFTCHNTHPYNIQWTHYFIRNRLLTLFNASWVHQSIYFIPVCYSLLSLCVTPLKNKYYPMMYVATVLYLVPSWLIEPRYYMIPFTLFLLMKEEDNTWQELTTLTVFVIMSLIFCGMIYTNTHFI